MHYCSNLLKIGNFYIIFLIKKFPILYYEKLTSLDSLNIEKYKTMIILLLTHFSCSNGTLEVKSVSFFSDNM